MKPEDLDISIIMIWYTTVKKSEDSIAEGGAAGGPWIITNMRVLALAKPIASRAAPVPILCMYVL